VTVTIPDRTTWVSGFRTLWMLVMFDLPVGEKEERSDATRFRNFLLDLGFRRAQFSVYYRLITGRDAAEVMEKKIAAAVPGGGSVHILVITNKQYENIRVFTGGVRGSPEKIKQLVLF